ncbi:hypothetical protein BABINDRAFT_33953 [Babjeviella inositovora NRRL Y-12698]|uniref:Altered inheritance rate of mitochondria protein 29 n=1 Tax=Babjeviella inositovora NRRL Y-12698 TaxID=984486 RepID=A0A1E3QU42_9ASCO|nr:uncharacterized protein BABINDRAFT_33953 [Babjeviella inositovora NRRL Y-12698]ODQ81180.1 hypothetical protein BABINDRAFT_33953 [Babjeviella inositovora NRRL Y-12698]
MSDFNLEEPLTSSVRPITDSIITVRIIKSFPYRNVKNVILKDVNLQELTPQKLHKLMLDKINTEGAYRPYRNVVYDTLKVYNHAHQSKSMNLVVNMEDDEGLVLKLDDERSVYKLGVENETELSLFNWEAYEEFKKNPEEKW